jgi:hypothetical protein
MKVGHLNFKEAEQLSGISHAKTREFLMVAFRNSFIMRSGEIASGLLTKANAPQEMKGLEDEKG